jgi:hypothetical protein
MHCCLCHRTLDECRSYFERVNAVGDLPGVWKCALPCESKQLSEDDKIVSAVNCREQEFLSPSLSKVLTAEEKFIRAAEARRVVIAQKIHKLLNPTV